MSLTIRFHGQSVTLDPSGAAYVEREATLVVADMHLEKGTAFAAQGSLLPPYDTRATLQRLGSVVERYRPKRVVCLGDTFHDQGADGRVDAADADLLAVLTKGRDWLWVAGNHDPAPPERHGGSVVDEVALDGLVLRHAARADAPPGEISGHYHPKATVRTRARTMSRRCFASDVARLILPAFGAYAGGLNVLDDAIAGLWSQPPQVYVIGGERIYPMPLAALRAQGEGQRPTA